MKPRTIIEKVWDNHIVAQQRGRPHAALHRPAPGPRSHLAASLRRPPRARHQSSPSRSHHRHHRPQHSHHAALASRSSIKSPPPKSPQLEANCKEFGIRCFGLDSQQQGIVHVIGPEQGLTQPGMTVVCGDSHTATHGAFGALAFGIGTSEVEHVLASQCLLQNKPKTYQVRVDGVLKPGVTAKDIILAMIARIGIGGGTGCIFEYCGSAIRALSMEERMTVCNMSIEAGARGGLIAPDDTTYQYMAGRPYAPKGAAWDAAVARWRELPTDEGAAYDKSITLDASALEPMITFGTNPGMGIPITAAVPNPSDITDPLERDSLAKALRYMDLDAGQAAARPSA